MSKKQQVGIKEFCLNDIKPNSKIVVIGKPGSVKLLHIMRIVNN